MTRHTMSFTCTEQGCYQATRVAVSSRQEGIDEARRHQNWKCIRHAHPDEVLSLGNSIIQFSRTYLNGKSSQYPNLKELFFTHAGSQYGNGFIYGDGWKAYANDFPAGTKVVIEVTARVILPEEKNVDPTRVS